MARESSHSFCDVSGTALAQPCGDFASDEYSPPAVGVLINTSLNPKGMPIANDIVDILEMFCNVGHEEMEYVLLEDWVFERAIVETKLCSRRFSAPDEKQLGSFPD